MNAHELVGAIERVAAGEAVIGVAEGLTDKAIAERLWLTTKTVETHIRHILRKLDLAAGAANNSRLQAVLAYLRAS